jgi:hypothetical protein
MNKLILAALLLPLLAHGATWVPVGEDGDGKAYVDQSSIIKQTAGYKVWSLASYPSEQMTQEGTAYLSVKTLHVYACAARTVTLLNQVYYGAAMGKGPVAQNIKYEKFNPEDIIPDSSDDAALQLVCKGAKKAKKK